MESITCPKCFATEIPLDAYFCPKCGAQLRTKSFSTSRLTQAGLYLGSLLLPPLGLWWAFKYYRIPDGKGKKIAIICSVLTIISLLIAFYLWQIFTAGITQQINSQMNNADLVF